MQRFELVTTENRFMQVEQPWQALWLTTASKGFQSHPWIAAWIKHKTNNYELRIGLIWQNDMELVAVLPMAIRKFFGFHILEWAGQAVCDYCDAIGSQAAVQEAWDSLQKAGGIDIVRLKNMSADANMSVVLSACPLAEDNNCMKVVSGGLAGDVWFQMLNKKKRNNFTRGQRILMEHGSTVMACHETAPDEALIKKLFTLKKDWLAATGQVSYLVDDAHPDRLLDLARALSKIGHLRLFVITCGDDLVAGSINIAEGRSIGAFFAAYNPKYDRASPGIMLMTAYTRWAFNSGFDEIDYLRGDEGYKFEFANTRSPLFSAVTATTARGRAALTIQRWLSRFSKIREERRICSRTGGAYRTRAGSDRVMGAL